MKFIKVFLFFLILSNFSTTSVYAHVEGVDKCLTAGFWIEDTVYDYFDPTKNPDSRNTFEEWATNQMRAWNNVLSNSGVTECFVIGKIVHRRDGELPFINGYLFSSVDQADVNDLDVDVQWGFSKRGWFEINLNSGHMASVINYIDWTLLHELSHARYLIDEYAFDLFNSRDKIEVTDPTGKPIIDNYLKPIAGDLIYRNITHDLMSDLARHFYGPRSAKALNLIAGLHTRDGRYYSGKFGVYLEDIPANNVLRILDKEGMPISSANIRIFNAVSGGKTKEIYAKTIDNIPDVVGTTDKDGKVSIGDPFNRSRQFNKEYLFILEISKNNLFDYKIIESVPFNLAFWSGAVEEAVYDIKANFIPVSDASSINILPTPIPPPTPTPTPIRYSTANFSIKERHKDKAVAVNTNITVKSIDEDYNPVNYLLGIPNIFIVNTRSDQGEYLVSTPEGYILNFNYYVSPSVYRIRVGSRRGYELSSFVCYNCTASTSYKNDTQYKKGDFVHLEIQPHHKSIYIYFKYTKTLSVSSIPKPSCSSYTTCESCINAYTTAGSRCGWGQGQQYLGENPLPLIVPFSCISANSICPSDYTSWYWSSCAINECTVVPTSKPLQTTPTSVTIPTPTPLPTPTPTPTLTLTLKQTEIPQQRPTKDDISKCAVECMDKNTLNQREFTYGNTTAACKFGNRYLPSRTVACETAYSNCYSYCERSLTLESPTPYPCIASGGSCIPSYPCNPAYTPSSLSCGDSGVCCVVAPSPTPTVSYYTPPYQPPLASPILSQETPTSTPFKQTREVKNITVNGVPVDLNNLSLDLNLAGKEVGENRFLILVIITYSDNTTYNLPLAFNYTPPTPTPTSPSSYTPCQDQCKNFPIEYRQACNQVCETPYVQYKQCINQCARFPNSPIDYQKQCEQVCDTLVTPTPSIPTPSLSQGEEYQKCIKGCDSLSSTGTSEVEACLAICENIRPTDTPTPVNCDCTNWIPSGGCGQQGCSWNTIPHYSSCGPTCSVRNACIKDNKCKFIPTLTPTLTVVPSCTYQSLVKCVDDKRCTWAGTQCVGK